MTFQNDPLTWNTAPEMLVIVRGEWRTVSFRSRSRGGAIWWFSDSSQELLLDDGEIRRLDTQIAAELAHLQNQWRERAEANRRRKRFGADGPIYRGLP